MFYKIPEITEYRITWCSESYTTKKEKSVEYITHIAVLIAKELILNSEF